MTGNVEQHVPVFVSSTYEDLKPHRTEVQRRLVGLEQIVRGMEYFGSSPDTPLETCLKKISDCKIFILLVGASYGSVHPDFGKSFTELEYEHAIKLKIPVLVYMADMNSTAVGIPLAGVDTKHEAELNLFKEKLNREHTVSTFTSIDDLGKRIEHDVPEMLRQLDDNISIAAEKNELSEVVNEDKLRENATRVEKFWLLPRRYAGEIFPLRLQIDKIWGGWGANEELVREVGLEVGDTIGAEVAVMLTNRAINEEKDTYLFAGGAGADWLLDNDVREEDAIDCYVRLVHSSIFEQITEKRKNIVALVLVKGIRVIHNPTFDDLFLE
ncbi:MAG: DUF4062 domain-containing protein [Clostridiales bacterium]|nr:DUF4062 domain-containing protein [Clostridiales bacterium]